MTTIARGGHTITIQQTRVTRYTALDETADGFSVTLDESDRHFQSIAFPGVIPVSSVIYYRTRHTGLPRFSIRVNSLHVTEYTFAENDPPERCWHEIIPANTLMDQNNEMVFAIYPDDPNGTIVFGDVVIFYTADETTMKIPITLAP
jgi:hypothetical protein